MSGNMNFKEALGMRLNIIKPTLNKVTNLYISHFIIIPSPHTHIYSFVDLKVEHLVKEDLSDIDNVLTPGVKELVDLLHERGVSVYVISGGFRRLIEPITNSLRIEKENLYCNVLLFNDAGNRIGNNIMQN